jgi:hypothetical protein
MNLQLKAQEPLNVTNDAGFLCGKESLVVGGKENRSVTSGFTNLQIRVKVFLTNKCTIY